MKELSACTSRRWWMGNLFHLPHTYNTQGKKKKEEGEEGNSLKKREKHTALAGT
jgi:hypothetical protein